MKTAKTLATRTFNSSTVQQANAPRRQCFRWQGLVGRLGGRSLWLAIALGVSSSLALPIAIAPPAVQAYTARADVLIDRRDEDENYLNLQKRAESVARAAAQRSFDRDILVSQVLVTVVVENNGTYAQILSLEVSRDEWKSRPDPRRWATYYRSAKKLLGFAEDTESNP